MHTFAEPLKHARRVSADRTALICGSDSETYADLFVRCCKLVAGLRGLGLETGDRIAVLSANCHRYVEIYAGVPAGGFVVGSRP